MSAVAEPIVESAPPARRPGITPLAELAVLFVAIAIGILSYFIVSRDSSPPQLLTPPVVALLLVANLLPGVALLVLLGPAWRCIALRARRLAGAGGCTFVSWRSSRCWRPCRWCW